MILIFISTTPCQLNNFPHLNFELSFVDDESQAKFLFKINKQETIIFIVTTELGSFFSKRPESVFEDEKFDALKSFIEKKCQGLNKAIGESYYAFHSHFDVFDEETFTGRSDYLSDETHMVWGFTHQEANEIYNQIFSNSELDDSAGSLMEMMREQ